MTEFNQTVDVYIWQNRSKRRQPEQGYGRWIEDIVQRYRQRLKLDGMRWDDFLHRCAFFVTITYSHSRIHHRKTELDLSYGDRSTEMDDFHLLYCAVAQQLYGKKWKREKLRHLIPLAVAALDFENTRYRRDVEGFGTNAHIHSIWVLPPREAECFPNFFTSAAFKLRLLDKLHIDKIDVQPFDECKASITKLASYALKALKKTEYRPLDSELLRIYPNKNYGPEPYQATRIYRNESKKLNVLRATAWRNQKSSC